MFSSHDFFNRKHLIFNRPEANDLVSA